MASVTWSRSLTLCLSSLAVAGLTLEASVADAHISFEMAGTHLSRYGDDEIKDGPCGRVNGVRGENVYTYEPGQTITISTVEFVPHPGYFRIAFDADGDDDFVEPRSIKPVDPSRKCPYDENDKCGESDFYNSEAVLMDNLDPHLAGAKKTFTWEVKLPDIECDNCTLQLIQVMEDTVHGPYSPKGASQELIYVEDIYHQCIDLVLKRGANPDDNPPPATGDGDIGGDGDGDGEGDGDGDDGNGNGDGDGDGDATPNGDDDTGSTGDSTSETSDGCSVVSGAGAAGVASLAAWLAPTLVLVSRRRRRQR